MLEPLARSSDADLARAAIRALGHLDQRRGAAPCSRAFLRGRESWQRAGSGRRAVTLGPTSRVADLLQWVAAVDDDADVVGAAVDALAQIGAPFTIARARTPCARSSR